jgi:putative oxidoreductase
MYCNWTGALVLSLVLLLARIVIGYGFYEAGKGKLGDIKKPIAYFTQLNIPFPEANAWFVSYVEYIGGALMIVGFISRPVCAILAIDMIVAYWTADREAVMALLKNQDVTTFAAATPFWFLFASLLVVACGPGWLSVDGIIKVFLPRKKVVAVVPPPLPATQT